MRPHPSLAMKTVLLLQLMNLSFAALPENSFMSRACNNTLGHTDNTLCTATSAGCHGAGCG